MRTLVLAVAFALATPAAALACGGQPCGEGCSMSAHQAGADFAAVEAAAGTKAWLEIEGMKCGKCSTKVTELLKGMDGVNAVAVSHESGKAQVAFDPAKVQLTKLVQAVTDLGYAAKKSDQA